MRKTKTSMNNILFTLISFLLLSIPSFAENTSDSSKTSQSQIYLETDPTALFFKGFSFVVRRSATFHKKLHVGLGVYKATLPDFYIEANPSNVGKDWRAKSFGVDLFTDYYFFNPNKGLSMGFNLSYYNFNISRLGKTKNYQSVIESVRVGYLWRPIKKFDHVYIYPWVGLSTGQQISGDNEIEGEKFAVKKWSVVPTFLIGFSF